MLKLGILVLVFREKEAIFKFQNHFIDRDVWSELSNLGNICFLYSERNHGKLSPSHMGRTGDV